MVSKRACGVIGAGVVALAAGAALGAEDPKPIAPFAQGVLPGIMALVVFLGVLAFMYLAVWPKITKALDERNAKIRDEIESAEAARRQAREALEEYEKSLSQARAEAQKMLEETKAQQASLAAKLRAEAEVELTAMRAKAKADIDTARKAAIAEIYAESVSLASLMAGKILKREVSAGDQQKLVDESLRQLQGIN